VSKAEVPPVKKPKTVAQMEYELLVKHPYQLTSDDIIYAVNGKRKGINRKKFFSKGQPCMRSSPLPKRYGWGVHSDALGKVAIFPMESAEYKRLTSDQSLKHLQAMRSKRA
jgi:hypothetical protein